MDCFSQYWGNRQKLQHLKCTSVYSHNTKKIMHTCQLLHIVCACMTQCHVFLLRSNRHTSVMFDYIYMALHTHNYTQTAHRVVSYFQRTSPAVANSVLSGENFKWTTGIATSHLHTSFHVPIPLGPPIIPSPMSPISLSGRTSAANT